MTRDEAIALMNKSIDKREAEVQAHVIAHVEQIENSIVQACRQSTKSNPITHISIVVPTAIANKVHELLQSPRFEGMRTEIFPSTGITSIKISWGDGDQMHCAPETP